MTEPDPARVPDDDLDELGGDPACWQAKVCQHCWRFVEERPDDGACPFCGTPLDQ